MTNVVQKSYFCYLSTYVINLKKHIQMKIYTKTGDKGKTSLISGHRVSKAHKRIEVYGTIDELNSNLGVIAWQKDVSTEIRKMLIILQNKLFDLGAQFASDEENPAYKLPDINQEDITFLEKSIDLFNTELPELKAFILPGGHPLIAQTHVARTICRRAERLAVGLSEKHKVALLHIQYLNRLSDFLFVLARKMASDLKVEEIKWKPDVDYNSIVRNK